jgi:hypothetical protein
MKILEADDYHEDYGDCLFFHFDSFEEPPKVYCGSPLDSGFDGAYWGYFTRDVDLNSVIEQAEKLHEDGLQEYMAN